jgi:integrase/recombinase XerD
VKSLLAFGHRLGYLPFDVGGAGRLPRLRGALAERTLSEADVHRLLALEPNARNRALLRLAYAGGLRVPELVALRWRDLQALRAASAADDGPVFGSRKGDHLTARQAQRLVDAAAKRAGLRARVSPHWLRHAHATHALAHGAPIHIVQATLGHASVARTGRYLHGARAGRTVPSTSPSQRRPCSRSSAPVAPRPAGVPRRGPDRVRPRGRGRSSARRDRLATTSPIIVSG